MRTTEQIKKEITDSVLANANLRQAFGLSQGTEWDAQVSKVSVLNLICYIVAMASRSVEWLHDQFREEVEERIAAALPGTVSWYWNKVMEFQYGDSLNEMAAYDTIDPTKRIVAFCAITEANNGIIVKASKANYEVLTQTELAALSEYVSQIKFAGTQAAVYSFDPDEVNVELNIWRDPMILDSDMCRISDGTEVIEEAITEYLDNIVYGGVFNKTKLIDAIQKVEGVLDVTIEDGDIYCPADDSTHDFGDFGQNFTSYAGHFTPNVLSYNDMISE